MRLVGTLIALLAFAAPAAARTNEPVVVPDGCGDVDTSIVNVNGTVLRFDAGRAAWHDIDSITFTALEGGGIDITMQLCADVPAPQVFTNGWYAVADAGPDCWIQIGVIDDLPGNPTRTGKLYRDCEQPDVLGRPGIAEVYNADLPATAWSVAGRTISWHLTRGLLSFAQTTSLNNVSGYTGDAGAVAGVPDRLYVNGPGTRDDAASHFTVTPG